MSAVNPTHIIAEGVHETIDTAADFEDVAAHVVSKLTEHGYSIVETAPGTCNADPMGTHRWVSVTFGIPLRPGWRCIDCHLNTLGEKPAAAAEGEESR